MTAAEELAKLETAYAAWIEAGCPQSYTAPGGHYTVTRASAQWMSDRIDALRRQVNSESGGIFTVSQFRKQD